MTIKTQDITITFENRDKGKRFRLKEMPALQAERWARRALYAMLQGGFKPDQIEIDPSYGMAALAYLPLEALARMEPTMGDQLMDEMLETCVKAIRTDQNMEMDLLQNEIEEIATLVYLRAKVVELHSGFFWIDNTLDLIRKRLTTPPAEPKATPNTSTPRPTSQG